MGEIVKLTAEDGHKLDAYLAQPDGKPKGGIVIVQEIFGVNSHIRGVADAYAADGYLTIAPAMFDRVDAGIELGYEAEDVDSGREIRGKVDDDMAVADMTAALNAVQSAGKVGLVGYCWGGYLAFLAATRISGLAAVSSYYGGGIPSKLDETPKCPMQFHFGEQDHAIPLTDVDKIKRAMDNMPVFIYPAGHGFNCEQRGSYEPNSAGIARERTMELMTKHIG